MLIRMSAAAVVAILWTAYAVAQTPADSLLAEGRYAEALNAYEEALKGTPKDAGAHVGAGEAALALERYQVAEEHFSKAVELEPNNARALVGLGRVYGAYQQYPKAVEVLRRALAASSGHWTVRLRLGDVYSRMGDNERAAAEYTLVLLADDRNAEARRGLSRVSVRQGRHREACEHLEKLEAQGQAEVGDYVELARLYEDLGDSKNCVTYAEKAAAARPDDPRINAILGRQAYRDARYKDAVDLLEKAGRSGADARSLEMLAASYDALQRPDQAIEAYEALLKVDPGNSAAKRALARLYEATGRIQEARRYIVETAGEEGTGEASRKLREFEVRSLLSRIAAFVWGPNIIYFLRAGALLLIAVLILVAYRRRSRRVSQNINEVISAIRRESAKTRRHPPDRT
ncbi:MAG: tetratricopeptide repeat protein [Planctomycetota bacterium]